MVGRSRLQLPVGPGERPALAHRARAHLEQASRAAADFSGAGHERYACRVRADSAQTWCAQPRLLQVPQKSADTTGPCSRCAPTSSEPTNPSGELSESYARVLCSQSW